MVGFSTRSTFAASAHWPSTSSGSSRSRASVSSYCSAAIVAPRSRKYVLNGDNAPSRFLHRYASTMRSSSMVSGGYGLVTGTTSCPAALTRSAAIRRSTLR